MKRLFLQSWLKIKNLFCKIKLRIDSDYEHLSFIGYDEKTEYLEDLGLEPEDYDWEDYWRFLIPYNLQIPPVYFTKSLVTFCNLSFSLYNSNTGYQFLERQITHEFIFWRHDA